MGSSNNHRNNNNFRKKYLIQNNPTKTGDSITIYFLPNQIVSINQSIDNDYKTIEMIQEPINKNKDILVISVDLTFTNYLTKNHMVNGKLLNEKIQQVINIISLFDKTIILEPLLSMNIVDKHRRIDVFPNIGYIENIRKFYSAINENNNLIKLPILDNLMLMEDQNGNCCFCDIYKRYVREWLSLFVKNNCEITPQHNVLRNKYNIDAEKYYNTFIYRPTIDLAYKNANERKIIVLSDRKEIEESFLKKYPGSRIETKSTLSLIDKEKVYYIIDKTDVESAIEKLVSEKYIKNKDFNYLLHVNRFILHNFVGSYDDPYNNHIKTPIPINLEIAGSGNTITIDSNNKGHVSIKTGNMCTIKLNQNNNLTGRIYCGDYATLLINNNNVTVETIEIRIMDYSLLKMGSDNLFASQSTIVVGDGHPIIDLETGLCINMGPNIEKNKNQIIIGNHNWFGTRCIILAKTCLGDDNVIGAGTICNKKYDNNCIIVGVPGKIIKKNITWTRYYNDLLSNNYLVNNNSKGTK